MQLSYRGNVLYICNEECHLAKVTRKEGSWQRQKCTNTGTNLTSKVQRNSPPLVSSERHVPPNATEYATGAHTTQREIDEFQLGKFNELCWNWVGLWWTRLTFVRIRCTCRLRMWHKIRRSNLNLDKRVTLHIAPIPLSPSWQTVTLGKQTPGVQPVHTTTQQTLT